MWAIVISLGQRSGELLSFLLVKDHIWAIVISSGQRSFELLSFLLFKDYLRYCHFFGSKVRWALVISKDLYTWVLHFNYLLCTNVSKKLHLGEVIPIQNCICQSYQLSITSHQSFFLIHLQIRVRYACK